MAEETDLSRSEPATPRRLQTARNAGDVPRSAEFARWVVLLAGLGVLGWLAQRVLTGFETLTTLALRQAAAPLGMDLLHPVLDLLLVLLPLLVALFVAALVAPLLLSGWTFAPQATRADFTRASPFKPVARLLSQDAWFDVFLTTLKLLLVAGAVAWVLENGWSALPAAEGGTTLHAFAAWVGEGVMAVALALTLAAALDAGWRWWRYLRRHAMTRQEVLAEAREAELPAEVQAQVRARQEQAARGGMGASLQSGEGANAGPKTDPLPNPLMKPLSDRLGPQAGKSPLIPQAGEGANAGPKTDPLPNPLPQAGEGANAGPTTINEVIG